MTIEYREMPGLPGRFFSCERYRATLSQTACAGRFLEAKSTAKESGEKYLCMGCSVGAVHAGVDPGLPAVLGAQTCVRCFSQSTRIMRNAICVSCYNREREVAAGRNAKGNAFSPVEIFGEVDVTPTSGRGVKIFAVPVGYQSSDKRPVIPAATTVELVLTALRRWSGSGPERPGVTWVTRSIWDCRRDTFGGYC